MNLTPFYISFVFSFVFFSLVGCRTTEKAQTTDWSLPSVKLAPTAKDEKVVAPAEKANAQATASLARDRLNGHNPSATIRNSADTTLRPNPEEMAKLHRFEGDVPSWASENGLPPGPEATHTTPATRIAQNVNDSTINSAQNTGSEIPASIQLDGPQMVANTPATNTSPDANMGMNPNVVAVQSAPELPTTLDGVPPTTPNGNAMPSAPNLPNTTVAQTELPPAGNTMLELPGNTPSGATLPVSASQSPSMNHTATNIPATPATSANPTKPAVLFMPGNIDPRYPNPATVRP